MKYLIGNFKINKTFFETESYICSLQDIIKKNEKELLHIKIGIAPSFDSAYLSYKNPDRNFLFGLQNIFYEQSGAYTGEMSLRVAKEAKVDFVLIGHSERRRMFNETNELINKKIYQLSKENITSILCVGESKEEFDNNNTIKVLEKQIKEGLKGIKDYKNIIISYEPVYCIGNGIVPEVEHIQKIVNFIHSITDKNIPILYGGSVCLNSINLLEKVKGLSGYLVGKASLNALDFVQLAKKIK
ncbi:triosephosphate isomerase [Metamycoplasma phocicerebrale]|uniref:Triosephosphate isomerase n=1 Tax=Metamycoplasma phocicerebrale TaxID=142649 RepID=A0A3T0TU44_9BACT|nr:triose-phosphate isomerase family protein [Metamycoplasma phocicerebrale]AZZ65554.1 triosephosphate isomerase [Metamycoplasma phocicerebrale]